MKKFDGACKELNCIPEVLFARGLLHGRPTLLFMSGPRLTLESLKQLREDIFEVLESKEKQLKGISDPDRLDIEI